MNNNVVENRLNNLKKVYDKLDTSIDMMGNMLPDSWTNKIKDLILNDKELRDFLKGIETRRTPRVMLLGRTGIGKSSLINAICEGYIAEVSDYKSCTEGINRHICKDDDGRELMEVLDSRGFSENIALKDSSAEDELLQDIIDFFPDVILLVLGCDRRDDSISKDLDFLKRASKVYKENFLQDVPIVAVINRADTVVPKTEIHPSNYSEKKITGINKVLSEYRKTFQKEKIRFNDVVAVSSLIEWKLDDGSNTGRPLTADDINYLTDEERKHIAIDFDGRYQIERLRESIENSIESPEARMGFTMALKLDALVLSLGKKMNNIFSSLAGAVAATPIPFSDISVLLPLQTINVSMIAALAGRELDRKSSIEFIFSLGGVSAAGFGCRVFAQQAAKILNAFIPTSGSGISSLIAFGATQAIGTAAIEYYLLERNFEQIKKKTRRSLKDRAA